jgi:uncharacterized protein YndB with AHSA1/START domain
MSEHTAYEDGGGFTVRRRLQGTPERVRAAFTEPERLEQWFVVEGYRTPAARMRVDARTGGRFDAVMVSETDGTEIPFGFDYVEVEPLRVVLAFTEPRERVTVTLAPVEGGTDLTYEFRSWPPPSDPAASRRGVEDMLDRIDAGLRAGTI